MQINFDKARKLINELEAKLNDTSTHTVTARKALDEWIQGGGVGFRKKSASALKQVRKRADSFNKALTKLEESLSAPPEKNANSSGKKDADKISKKPAGKVSSKKAKPSAPKKAAKAATPLTGKGAKRAAASKKKAPAKADS